MVGIEKINFSGGVEGLFSVLGKVFIIVGCLSLIVCIIISGNINNHYSSENWGANGFSALWIIMGIAVLFQCIAFFIFSEGGSEIIKLLKKLNALPYSGAISGVNAYSQFHQYICRECKTPVDILDKKCKNCNKIFE